MSYGEDEHPEGLAGFVEDSAPAIFEAASALEHAVDVFDLVAVYVAGEPGGRPKRLIGSNPLPDPQ